MTPDFTTWTRENLERYAAEAYNHIRLQRELIQLLRQLVANIQETRSGKPS